MYPPIHSYLLWRSTVKPDPQRLASCRYTAAVSLLPATMVGIFVFGWWAGSILLLSIASAFVTDFVCHRYIFKDSPGTREGTWMLTGLLIALMLPPNVHWLFPVLGAGLAVFLGKYYLSVDGMPLLQPAAVGLLVLHLIGFFMFSNNSMLGQQEGQAHWPVLARGIGEPEDMRSSPHAVKKLLQDFFGGDVRKSVTRKEYREAVFSGRTPMLPDNTAAQAVHGERPIEIVHKSPSQPVDKSGEAVKPGAPASNAPRTGWLDMLLGYVPATIGGSSALALTFGILLLIFTGAASPTVPMFAMLTMFASLHFFSWISGGTRVVPENIPIHLLTGSTLLGLFYLAADPTSTPRSFIGKVYAGVALGLIEVLIRLFTPLAEGIFISVVLVQCLSMIIDQYLAPPTEDSRNTVFASLTPSSLGRL